MKKLLVAALVSSAALCFAPSAARAGTFGLIPHCLGCRHKCVVKIRPYNAFTPTISGCITSFGCSLPVNGGGGHAHPDLSYAGAGLPNPVWANDLGNLPPTGDPCPPGATITPAPASPAETTPAKPTSAPAGPPPIAQIWPVSLNQMLPYGYGQPAGVNPYANPYANPYYGMVNPYSPSTPYTQPMAVPYYWNTNGR